MTRTKPGPPTDPATDPLSVRLLYSPHDPHPRQHAFLVLDQLDVLEAFYGGAGGGGKSDALLMAALRYVDVPGYSALILRKTFADLNLPGAMMSRAREWLAGTDAVWNERDSRWTFPSGATLSFGYLDKANDRYRYAGAEFQFIAFDELTQFPEDDYRFLFSRLRRPDTGPLSQVPLRMRSASNPGGRGHQWVRRRLVKRLPAPVIEGEAPDPHDTPERAAKRAYIPAKLSDNPSIDADSYRESLAQLDPFVRAQILDGDWDARPVGNWVYDQAALTAAEALGAQLDQQLRDGTIPPPAGDLLAIGIDWGEHTAALIGWPLASGGLYLAAEATITSMEPGAAAGEILQQLDLVHALGSQPRPKDWEPDLTPVERLAGNRRAGGQAPALPPKTDAVRLVEEHRYDAAGIQPMRTYIATVRKRDPQARSKKVSFGAAAPISGKNVAARSYKAETIGYIRRLLERTLAGDDIRGYVDRYANELRTPWDEDRRVAETKRIERSGKLAIGGRCPETLRQLQALEWLDADTGTVRKGDDHNADALIALAAPLSTRNR